MGIRKFGDVLVFDRTQIAKADAVPASQALDHNFGKCHTFVATCFSTASQSFVGGICFPFFLSSQKTLHRMSHACACKDAEHLRLTRFGNTEAQTHERFLRTDPSAFFLPEMRILNLLATPWQRSNAEAVISCCFGKPLLQTLHFAFFAFFGLQ